MWFLMAQGLRSLGSRGEEESGKPDSDPAEPTRPPSRLQILGVAIVILLMAVASEFLISPLDPAMNGRQPAIRAAKDAGYTQVEVVSESKVWSFLRQDDVCTSWFHYRRITLEATPPAIDGQDRQPLSRVGLQACYLWSSLSADLTEPVPIPDS